MGPSRFQLMVAALSAPVMLAAAFPHAARATDIALRRDGRRDVGTLQSCTSDHCRFAGSGIARADLAWLGLGVADDASPPPAVTAGELAVLASGELVPGPIDGISLGVVVAGGRSIDRTEVRWVRFAVAESVPEPPPIGATSPSPPADRPPESGDANRAHGGGDAPPPPEGGGGRDAPPRPREPGAEPVRPCPADRPLGGEIVHDYTIQDRDYHRCSGTARLWFRLHAMPAAWPAPLGGTWHSDAIDYRLVNHGCTDVPDGFGRVCSAPPQPEIRGRVVLGEVGQFGVNLIGAPGGPVAFHPLAPALSFLTLPDEIRHRAETPLSCVERSGSSSGSWQFPVIGEIGPYGVGDCSSCAAGVCLAPTRCEGATDPALQLDCNLHPDRYAVIPFSGSKSAHCESGGVEQVRSFRWKVCCGCGEPPSGPPPEFPQDPCGDPAPQRGLLEVAVAKSAALRAELRPRFARYQQALTQAANYRSDFELVSNSCAGWDLAMTLAEALIGGVGGAEVPEGAAAFARLYGILTTLVDQDPSVVLEGTSELELDLLGVEGFTVGDIWELVSTIYDTAVEVGGAGSIEGMRGRLEDCMDVPLVSQLVYDGARDYLRFMEAAFRELPEIHHLTTRIEQADADLFNRWSDYYRACLAYAECHDLDPRICGLAPS